MIGHMAQTLSNSVLYNYHHLGDAASITDGLPYNKNLGPYEVARDVQVKLVLRIHVGIYNPQPWSRPQGRDHVRWPRAGL